MITKVNQEIFFKNLSLTQAYCEEKINDNSKSIARTLRSLNLEYKGRNVFQFKENKTNKIELVDWNFELFEDDYQLVEAFFELQLSQKIQVIEGSKKYTYKGRVIVSEFGSVIMDGVSAIESNGFIDDYDLPPIDTWFYLLERHNLLFMFAWIPEKFEKFAHQGIEVNCLDILYWLKDADTELYSLVKNQP